MIVLITNPVFQTYIFSAILLVALLISFRKRQDHEFFPIAVSQELKGFAILTVVFAHVAYALVSDSKFLDPLSTMAGVGVNLFLILSGYGLIISALKKPGTIWQFYKYRLAKLYVPFWIFLIIFFALDFFVLKINYGPAYMLKAFLGFFDRANLYLDVNSPFWYFTWIVMYYLIFPWLLIRKVPWLSAILIYAVTFLFLYSQPHFFDQVIHLYRVHLIAFPLGVFLGWLFNYSVGFWKLKERLNAGKNLWFQLGASILLIAGILYFAKHSGVGEKPIIEETISIVTSLLLIALFLIKRIEIKTFYWLGLFSYEIYMFHWPLMYRYDFLFKYLPAWLALSLYLVVFVGIGWLFKQLIDNGGKLLAKKA
jgi:peptidoglycan/LPS O-acetylase OafA/YrhL